MPLPPRDTDCVRDEPDVVSCEAEKRSFRDRALEWQELVARYVLPQRQLDETL